MSADEMRAWMARQPPFETRRTLPLGALAEIRQDDETLCLWLCIGVNRDVARDTAVVLRQLAQDIEGHYR